MREILFRGKRKDNGKWVIGFYWHIEEHRIEALSKRHFIKSINNGIDFEVIPETVGQYTGLTDKNGKKIFEGDKCRVTRHCILCYGFITFKNGSFWFDEFNTDSVLELSKLKINNFEIEVIGSIHDNLLEVAE